MITKPFLIGATEVTVREFQTFVDASGYVTEAEQYGFSNSSGKTNEANSQPGENWREPGYAATDAMPVSHISWNDATAFCEWLTKQEEATYRLPTEAEWEYACRAGTTTQFWFGDDFTELEKYAWTKESDGGFKPHPVGLKPPNPFGLLDVCGNNSEWCQDVYRDDWYLLSPVEDPTGPTTGDKRILRGGRWSNYAFFCRSAHRADSDSPHRIPTASLRGSTTGFRVVRVLDTPAVASTGSPLNLIVLFDIDKGVAPWRSDGAKNQWSREAGELKFDADGKPGLVKFPTMKLLDANYRLELEFTLTSGTNGFNLDLPMSSGLFSINLDEGGRGRTGLGKTDQFSNSFHIEQHRRYRLTVIVEGQNPQDSVLLEVDGKRLLPGQGNRLKVAVLTRGANAENTKWHGVWIPARGSSFTFHRLQVIQP